MSRTAEDREQLKNWMNEAFLPVWRGQVDDWEAGLNWVAEKTSWKPETIKETILPWLYEWNRQKDLADKQRKFMAELPNIGVFFRKQKWKNPLPYSFQELKGDEKPESRDEPCVQCGGKAFNRKLCCRCYTKLSHPDYAVEVKNHLRAMGYQKVNGETWQSASMRCLEKLGLKSMVPRTIK